jgi:hypothetical protein
VLGKHLFQDAIVDPWFFSANAWLLRELKKLLFLLSGTFDPFQVSAGLIAD